MLVTPRFWIANRVSLRSVDLLFRIASASVLPPAGRYRFLYSGIDAARLDQTLRRVRGLRAWPVAWVRTARGYLRAARDAERRGDIAAAAANRASAALCYHFSQVFELSDIARKRRLYRQAAALFRRAAPHLDPPAEYVEIPWRDISLPGYLRVPRDGSGPYPVLVMLNGASTVKEETANWSEPFLRRGLATLALDTPGSGEAWERQLGMPGQEDVAEALIRFAAEREEIDASAVAVLGVSLRGALAVQLGARCDRLAAVIAVTAPYQPAPYFRHLSRLVRQEIAFVTGAEPRELKEWVGMTSLEESASQLTVPLLVVGAGHDLVVPPIESVRLYRAARGPKRLLYLPTANHVGFSHMDQWTAEAASWLISTLRQRAKAAPER